MCLPLSCAQTSNSPFTTTPSVVFQLVMASHGDDHVGRGQNAERASVDDAVDRVLLVASCQGGAFGKPKAAAEVRT